ncbi:GDP-mannose-dependent alpha-(1-6)-phosphatidylinositol monomannoside mannosyltransferase [compost metagenome]
MRITLIASDESTAPLYRVRLLARVLAQRFDVEVLGYHFDPAELDPQAPRDFPYRALPACPLPGFLSDARKLAEMASGDVIYAMKPRPTSFGTALWAAKQRGLPLVVDVDDWEPTMIAPYSRYALKNAVYALPHLRHPNNYLFTAAFDRMLGLADGVTTVSRFFMERYGGRLRGDRPFVLAPQYVDTERFDPTRYDREAVRQELGCERFTLVFAGIAQPNKGVGLIVQALRKLQDRSWELLIVGPKTPYALTLAAEEPRVRLLGTQPPEETPRFLAAADVVALPQQAEPASLGQMPMKLFEAMAMGCPVVSTRLADIPEVLDGCGLVVAPGDPAALAEALAALMAAPACARALGAAARRKVLARYSYAQGAEVLGDLMLRVAGAKGLTSVGKGASC